MARWKGLPEALEAGAVEFVVQLRRHKDRSGLSMTGLAGRTGVSRASWDRYLNGRALAPAHAVRALAVVCGVEPARLLALRDLAAESGIGETGTAVTGSTAKAPEALGDSAPGPAGSAHGRQPVPWVAMVLTSVVTSLMTLAVLMVIAPWEDDVTEPPVTAGAKPYTGASHPELGEFVFVAGKNYPCAVKRDAKDGLLYAGYTRTRTEMIQHDSTRWSVVEAQCLLHHHGISPGGVDGAFGSNTVRAVKRMQDRKRIVVDGMVGPDTWKVLRR
ncbi:MULTISPECIES: helix-turn-helix domain-containing protein [unclassified Streptomyces]|uniref:helix-turn-helix domain-containing protein n=1 Tax=unclassified Streptomyces TaxID=2593676 RepID=UPI003787D456